MEHLLGDEHNPNRLAYELDVQNRLSEVIADAQRDLARARLLHGVNGGGGPQ